MKLHAVKSAHPKRGESVTRSQIAERSLHGCTTAVEIAEALRVALHADLTMLARLGQALIRARTIAVAA